MGYVIKRGESMAIKLHKEGYEHAEEMVRLGVEVDHFSDNWDEVKPTVDDELNYIDCHTLDEYGLWYLGVDTNIPSDNRAKYVYPYGDFNVVQESALIVAEQEAKKNNHDEIAVAARELLKKVAHTKMQ